MTITDILKLQQEEEFWRRRNKQTSCSLGKGLNNNILRSVTYVIMSPDTDKMAQEKFYSTHYWKL
jgi:hypothetical protein